MQDDDVPLQGSARERRRLIGTDGAAGGSSSTRVRLGQVLDDHLLTGTDVLAFRQPAESMHLQRRPLRATVETQGRGAGMLGASFTPDPMSRETVVSVHVGGASRAGSQGRGLLRSDAEAVLVHIEAQSTSSAFVELGPGRLEVRWGDHHPIDSFDRGFGLLAERLIPLLTLAVDATDDEIALAWRRQADAVCFQRVLDAWRARRARQPEGGAFGAAASEVRLATLEADLGGALPDALKQTLRRVDGASFDDAGTTAPIGSAVGRSDGPGPGGAADAVPWELLSTSAMRELAIGAHLPFARNRDGDLLVVERLGGDPSVRLAPRGDAPGRQEVVYPRCADFLEEFIGGRGRVRVR